MTSIFSESDTFHFNRLKFQFPVSFPSAAYLSRCFPAPFHNRPRTFCRGPYAGLWFYKVYAVFCPKTSFSVTDLHQLLCRSKTVCYFPYGINRNRFSTFLLFCTALISSIHCCIFSVIATFAGLGTSLQDRLLINS
jgi:hypothetical protein